MKKIFMLGLIALFGFAIQMNAQVVKEKPKAPAATVKKSDVEKPPTSANWVWVTGEWEWKSKSDKYKWVEAHWAKAPENKNYWHAGYWKKVKNGWRWESGYWE